MLSVCELHGFYNPEIEQVEMTLSRSRQARGRDLSVPEAAPTPLCRVGACHHNLQPHHNFLSQVFLNIYPLIPSLLRIY
jgi:hypothetical protein